MRRRRSILLTGATGALGTVLLAEIARTNPDARLLAVTRGATIEHPRAEPVTMDLARLSTADMRRLGDIVSEAELVIHAAADVGWQRPLDEAMRANFDPTARLVEAARAAKTPPRFLHISTAFTTPPTRKLAAARPAGLEETPFANAYEYSKWRAEACVKQSGLDWTVVRPSLIVGSSRDGSMPKYNGIYPLFRLFAAGMAPIVPGDPAALVDFVPVDWVVARTLEALAGGERIATVSAGPRALPLGRTIAIAHATISAFRARHGCKPIPPPSILDPERYQRFHRNFIASHASPSVMLAIDMVDTFAPYLSALEPVASQPDPRDPDPAEYFPRVVEAWCAANVAMATRRPFDWNRVIRSSA